MARSHCTTGQGQGIRSERQVGASSCKASRHGRDFACIPVVLGS